MSYCNKHFTLNPCLACYKELETKVLLESAIETAGKIAGITEVKKEPTWTKMPKYTLDLTDMLYPILTANPWDYIKLKRSTTPGLEWSFVIDDGNHISVKDQKFLKKVSKDYEDKMKDVILRPLGDITGDLEPLMIEMAEQHNLQWGEILALVHSYLTVHLPDNQELYEDDTRPVYFYGAKDEN